MVTSDLHRCSQPISLVCDIDPRCLLQLAVIAPPLCFEYVAPEADSRSYDNTECVERHSKGARRVTCCKEVTIRIIDLTPGVYSPRV